MQILIDTEKCIGCGLCVEMCPEGGVLAMEDEISKVVNIDRCSGCRSCEVNCEYGAVKVQED